MKRINCILFSLLPVMGFAQDVAVKVIGKVNFPIYDQSNRQIYFLYQQHGVSVIDSTLIKNNTFSFSKNLDIQVKTELQFTKPNTSPNAAADPNVLNFFTSKGTVEVAASGYLGRAKVTGSAMQDEYVAFKKTYLKMDTTLRLLGWKKKGTKTTDTAKMAAVEKQIDSVRNQKMNSLLNFLAKDNQKPYAADAILMYLRTNGSSLDLAKAQMHFDALPPAQKQSTEGKEIVKEIADLRQKTKK
ncbi:DUF4369 domain-containing protein [Pedobacter sp. MW01-1-1]|uniref:DUF4369 domain-containing protein n=1 Tax=Pedobacter sp. MW01-1-1 TaxID=3383027 RepID=UPI003FF0728A